MVAVLFLKEHARWLGGVATHLGRGRLRAYLLDPQGHRRRTFGSSEARRLGGSSIGLLLPTLQSPSRSPRAKLSSNMRARATQMRHKPEALGPLTGILNVKRVSCGVDDASSVPPWIRAISEAM